MNSQPGGLTDLYEDQVLAHRQAFSRESIVNRWSEPSVVLSAVALLITVAVKACGPDGAFENLACALWTFLWNCLVFVLPAPLLFAVDGWMNPPSSARPMLDAQLVTHASKGEALRRIMGLDRPGGMMASVLQARTRALSMTGSVLGLKLDSEQPPGLGNRDNSCYQNSILQGLAALGSLPDYLSACVRIVDAAKPDKDVAQTLRHLIGDLNDVSNNGKTMWAPGLLKSMSTWTQQDAQEYYSKLLDDIDKGVARAVLQTRRCSGLEADCGKDETAASQHSDDSGYLSLFSSPDLSTRKTRRNPLEGLLAQRVACVECGYSEGLSMIPFNCLTLSLGLEKHRHDLYERLDAYTKVESIEGVECPKCTLLKARRLLKKLVERMTDGGSATEQLAEPRRRLEAVETALLEDDFDDRTMADSCKISSQSKVSSTKTKQIVIARPPQSLVIHVNRSVFDPTTLDMIKNSAPVSFPLTLDLGPWCLGSSERSRKSCNSQECSSDVGADEEQWHSDATESMIAGDSRRSRLTGPIYELRAAVTHSGRHENGHYICYRTYPGGGDSGVDSRESLSPAIDEGMDEEEAGTGTEETKAWDGNRARMTGWWRLSDDKVCEVDEETVLGLSPGVFMLFYECVEPSMVKTCEAEDMEEEEAESRLTTANGVPRSAADVVLTGRSSKPRGEEGTGAADMANGRWEPWPSGMSGPEQVPLPASDDGELVELQGDEARATARQTC